MVLPMIGSGNLPESRGTVHVAPGPDGSLYIVVDSAQDTLDLPPSHATVTLLDRTGATRSGWPILIDGWSCAVPMNSPRSNEPLVAADGSLRLRCFTTTDSEEAGQHAAFAFTSDGALLPGWPVDLRPDDFWVDQTAIVGTTMTVSTDEIQGNAGSGPFIMASWVIEIARDGAVTEGRRVPVAGNELPFEVLGRDGILRLTRFEGQPVMTAIGVDGSIQGWPVTLDPAVSAPAAGPDGRTYLVQASGNATRTVVLGDDGAVLPIGSDALDISQWSEWTGAGSAGGQAAPIVTDDGSVYLIENNGKSLEVVGLDPGGSLVDGFPVTVPGRLEYQGRCTAQDTGCGVWTVPPVAGSGNVLYLPLQPRGQGGAGSVIAIGPDGKVVPGWPVSLPSGGGAVWFVAPAADGTVYAVTVDDAAHPKVFAVVAIEPDGRIRYSLPVITPR